jgi:glycerol uptake facilitator-like aquaporin
VITAAYWFTASTSFANPAVTVARALSNTFAGIMPGDVPAFILAQLFGAGLAVITAERVFGWVRLADEAATLAPAEHAERLST